MIIYVLRCKKDLHTDWGDSPFAFKGTSMANFPNYFYILGPNTASGHSSLIYIVECQVNYVVDSIIKVNFTLISYCVNFIFYFHAVDQVWQEKYGS